MDILIDRKKLFKTLTYLIVLLFLANYVADKFYWYYSIWWFDMPMHFLGGFFVGLALIWLLSYKNFSSELSFNLIFKIFLGIFLMGIGWEIFEILFNNIIAQNSFNILDTVSDIFFDLAGGTFALLYFLKKTMGVAQNKVQSKK